MSVSFTLQEVDEGSIVGELIAAIELKEYGAALTMIQELRNRQLKN